MSFIATFAVVASVAFFSSQNSKQGQTSLFAKNVEALAQDEANSDAYPDYYNKGVYIVTRDGGGSAMLDADSFGGKLDFESDVVLVTYHNDCVSKSSKTCYKSMRVMPPIVMYTRPQP